MAKHSFDVWQAAEQCPCADMIADLSGGDEQHRADRLDPVRIHLLSLTPRQSDPPLISVASTSAACTGSAPVHPRADGRPKRLIGPIAYRNNREAH